MKKEKCINMEDCLVQLNELVKNQPIIRSELDLLKVEIQDIKKLLHEVSEEMRSKSGDSSN